MFELILLAQLAVIDCVTSHPGDVRPKGWAWRTIDGRQCWYEGPPMMPKERLRWPLLPAAELPPPEFITDHQPFPTPPPPTEFELRWRGE
jgi:hypothetical protein